MGPDPRYILQFVLDDLKLFVRERLEFHLTAAFEHDTGDGRSLGTEETRAVLAVPGDVDITFGTFG